MKKNYFLIALFLFASVGAFAQTTDFDDDMESYTEGTIIENAWWTVWNSSTVGILSSSEQANSGSLSGKVGDDPTTIDPVLNLGNKIFDTWYTNFMMYVPADKEAYWNLQGEVPIGSGEWIIGNIFMNQDLAAPGVGLIDNCVGAPVNFTFPHGAWFEVEMIVDISAGISAATWELNIDGNNVIPAGTAFTDSAGTVPTSLGGINYYAISTNNTYYLDDLRHADFAELGTADFASKGFSATPNPVVNVLNLQANENISSVAIYNVLGQQVYAANIDALSSTIDMSQMASGAYFVKVNINGTEGTVKVIK
ncbi:MAG: T9SS type A sorting domain-containing protein [Flavobacteriaceae bacterium]|nr:T9SS type A sorting domain-containing protein [Flavobacteriaceae bacterium]